ncbi:MAG: hypothetical protein M3N43_08470 [Actinomycetota bacterium]|nr:hypothetical protein [Actinomycetota bacterium]
MQIVGDISDNRCHFACPEFVDGGGSRLELVLGSGIDYKVPAGPRQLGGKGMTEPT